MLKMYINNVVLHIVCGYVICGTLTHTIQYAADSHLQDNGAIVVHICI